MGLLVSEASAATFEWKAGKEKETLLAIYGFPPETEENVLKEKAIGGGLARNFGFGTNMLFQAATKVVGENIFMVVEEKLEKESTELKIESCDTFLGGTLMSNKTGENQPLGLGIEFADIQCDKLGKVSAPAYSDTHDQKWIVSICAPGAEKCKLEPLHTVGELEKDNVEIEHVAINIGAPKTPLVIQGTAWGKWENGVEKTPPCIKLQKKPANATASQNLIVTQSESPAVPVGTVATNLSGKLCLISANNNWYNQAGEKFEPEIVIANT